MARRRAFTLMEILTAIAIILLLAAISFPVLAEARRAGFRAESIEYLRQVGLAIEMYRDDHDGQLPFRHLDPFVETGYIKTPGILHSHVDAFRDGYGYTFSQCLDRVNPMQTKMSYETLLNSKEFFDWVKSYDPNAAIVVDRTHGSVYRDADLSCRQIPLYYSGRILRMYEDTHVKVAQFSLEDRTASPSTGIAWHRAKMFTDEDPPPLQN